MLRCVLRLQSTVVRGERLPSMTNFTVRFWSGWGRVFGADVQTSKKNNNWFLHYDNAPAHTSLVFRQFLTSKNITVISPPQVAWPRSLRFFPIPQDEITAERASFWHDWGDPCRNVRSYRHTHIWELPGMREIVRNTLGSLYRCPRGLLRRWRWKVGVTVGFFYGQIPRIFG